VTVRKSCFPHHSGTLAPTEETTCCTGF